MSVRSYEIRIDGPIGPVVASTLPGFTAVQARTGSTVLTGTVADAEGLVAMLGVLNAHGFSPVDILINFRPGQWAGSDRSAGDAPGSNPPAP